MKDTKFEKFAQQVIEQLKEKLGEGYTFDRRNVLKNNGVMLHGVIISRADENMSPTIYLDGAYRLFTDGYSMDVIVGKLYEGIMDSENSGIQFDAEKFKDFQQIKDHIIYRLINAAKNKDLLKNVPHILYLDLAICFAVCLEQADGNSYSVMISEDRAKAWGVTAEQLLEYAQINTPMLCPERSDPIVDVIRDTFNDLDEDYLKDCPMMILTNKSKYNGASVILYPDIMSRVSEKMGDGDIILLPGSIHEWILLPADEDTDMDYLRSMVQQVNQSSVEREEVLSDKVYIYRADEKKVEIAA